MKKLALVAFSLAAAAAFSAPVIPEVSNVRQTVGARWLYVTYDLSEDAIVTFDVLTNGVSIGEGNLTAVGEDGESTVRGDAFRLVSKGTGKRIDWHFRAAWPNHRGNAKVVVTAWPTNDKPPYMVVDISSDFAGEAQDRIRYYATSNGVPGGITENFLYKTNAIVFKRIYARNRSVTMGLTTSKTTLTLTNDFYLGVFEVTQAQWGEVWQGPKQTQFFLKDGAGRPVDNTTYNYVRESKNNTAVTDYRYPLAPCPDSYLGTLRSRCGGLVDFDLPTRDEWIFAAAGGYGLYYWGDGTPVTTVSGSIQSVCPNLDGLGRYAKNGGWVPTTATERTDVATNDVNHGTAIVGTYRPNAFGIYDMHGNVLERVADVRDLAYGGDCHRGPASCLSQNSADEVQPGANGYSYSRGTYAGFRLACRNGLK